MKIAKAELVRLVTAAGLKLERDRPDILPYQTFLIFRKPQELALLEFFQGSPG